MQTALVLSIFAALLLGETGGQEVVSQCPPGGWMQWQTYCYLFVNTSKVTWPQAGHECQDRQGHLLRVESDDEFTFVKKAQMLYKSNMYWTALNNLPVNTGANSSKASYMWGNDEFTIPSVVDNHWDREPDNTPYKDCVHVSIQATLTVADCNERHAYICELPVPQGGICAQGWTLGYNNQYCYKVSDASDWSKTLTWDQARKTCEAPENSHSHLIGVTNRDVQNFLATALSSFYNGRQVFWTGLNDRTTEGTFLWADGTKYDASNFDGVWRQEPNNLGGSEHCGALLPNARWGDFGCDDQKNYICRLALPNAPQKWNMNCGSWTRAGTKCVYVYNTNKTWTDARSFCQSMNGDLLKFDTQTDVDWMTMQSQNSLVQSRMPGYWIGLNDRQTENTFRWADGSMADGTLLNWDQEPNGRLNSENCAVMSKFGHFKDFSCWTHAGSICEDTATPCSPQWMSYGGHCYLFDKTYRMRSEASDHCKTASPTRTGRLFALNTAAELAWLKTKVIQPNMVWNYWSGLLNDADLGGWTWENVADQDPSATQNLVQWGSEPNDMNGNEDCVTILANGNLNDRTCTSATGFICQRTLNGGHSTAPLQLTVVALGLLVSALGRLFF